MKKRLIPIALVMGAISANAQVGIGTPTPNKSAELTIQADRRGLLIPNVSLLDTKDSKTIEFGNVNSLLVWNTATVKDVTPGYYYWFVDKWERLTADSDIPAIVVNNFENILNMDGDKVTNLIKNIVRNTEGNVIYEGDKLYYINADGDKVEINFADIVAANESKTVVVSNTSKKQQYYISESYLQVNDTPTQATIDTWTAGTVPAGVYAIDVVGGVVNNFEEVVNHGPINVDGRSFPTINDYITYLTESTGGFTKIVYDPTTGDAIFQEWNEATNSWVNVSNAKFKKIVTDNESKTVIVSNTSKKQQYYIAEAYVQTNGLPTQATIDAWTVGNTPEGVYAIDVVGGVVNNFQEFVNHGPITVDGRTYPTVNDYITYLTESTGGFTKIVYDSQNRNASFQQWDEATSSWVNVINSKFKKIITDNESQTQIITVDGNQYYVSEAYLAANDGVVPTTVNPANLPAGIYAIDVVGGVVNNFEEIVTNGPINVDGRTYPTINDYITYLTETTGGFTKIVYDQTTGDVIFQEWDASTNTWVNVDNSKFETIVQANESKTTIITVDGNQYYVSEEYLIANNGVVPTTVTPANLPAGIYAIDVVGGVVNNFEEIVTNGPITVDGRTYPTINDYITHLTETTGGFTKIVYDQSTGDVIFQEWDASTNTWVNVDNSKFETIVQANESKTTIIRVDGKQYYVSEEYLIANNGVVPTTVTPANLPAGIYAIDVVGGVVNNFEEIVTNGPITVDGRTYPTINDYITHLTETTGGFTKIVYDQSTGDVIFQEWDASTNTWVNVDNSKFETIVQANESKTTIITVDGKQYYVSEEYLIANNGVVPTTVTPANLPAGIYAIDVVGGVVNNFEEIVTNGPITVDGRTYPTINDYITHLTETTGGFTKIVYDQSTGDVIFQEWDASTNTWVNVDNSKFETIVQANESKTTIITVDGKQYYVSEEYLIANNGVVPTTVTPANLPAGIYAIDVVGGVVNNFEEIVTNGPITVDGRTYPTINDYITHLTETTGGFTKIVYDQTTGDVIFQEWDASTNTWVNVDNSKFKTIVTENETVTKLVQNTNGTYTYYNEKEIDANGQPVAGATGVTIDPALVIVEDLSKSNGTYIFKDSEGNTIATIDINSDNILYDNSDSGLTSTNVKDALDELATTIATTKGDLTVEGGLEFTGTTDGTAKLLADAGIQIADGGVSTDKIADGAVTEDKIGDKAVTADKLDGGQGADGRVGVAGADGTITYKTLDEVVKANETVTVFVENPNGTYTYYNEDQIDANGQPKAGVTGVTIDPKEVSVALNTTTNKYEFKDSNGDVIGEIDANANAIAFDDSTTNLNVTNVQGAIEKLLEKISTVEGTKGDLTVAGGLEFTGTTDGTAKLLADAGIQIADKGVTAAKLDAGKGEDGRVGVADGDGNVTYQIIDTVVKANETVTVLVQNGNGTFTYYNENEIGADGQPKAGATGVTIDPKEVSVALNTTTKKYEFKNSAGTVIGEIDANANAIAYNDNTTQLGATNVQEAIEKLLTKISTVEGTKGALTSPSIYVDGGTDALLKDAKIDLKGGSADGQVLVTVTKEVVIGQDANGDDIKETRKVTEWQDPKEFVSTTVTAKNGITVVNDADGNSEFRLGGPLDKATVITTSTTNTLAIKGMENVTTAPTANNLVIADADGVLKQTSAKNMIEDVITQGDLEAKMLKGVGITVTAGENAGTNLNTEVASSLLKDVTLGIADKAVTAGKLDAGTTTTDAPRIGVADQNGNVTYQDVQTVVQAEQKTVVLEDGTNTTVSSHVNATNPNETIWKVDVANAVKTVAAATALAATDAVVLVNAQAAPTEGIVITLPDADATNKGKKYTIKKLDTNEDGYVVIAGNVAGLNGKTLETGLPYSGWDFVSDGTQWQIVNKF
ncbi:beta strand repeat-containing protein [Myroides odoratus]